MASPQIQFRAVPPLDERLAVRAKAPENKLLSDVARRDLERFYSLLGYELDAVRRLKLSVGQASAICVVLANTYIDEQIMLVRYLHQEIEDAKADGLGETWGIDVDELAGIVRDLPLGQKLAIVDAVERWRRIPRADGDTFEPSLREAGLIP